MNFLSSKSSVDENILRTKNFLHYLLLILILGSGVVLRLYYINQPIRLDEAETFRVYLIDSFSRAISNCGFPNYHKDI